MKREVFSVAPINKFYEHYCPAAEKNVTVREDLVSGERVCMEENCRFSQDCRSRFIKKSE
ncbi:MAG TPA: hypothetical protein IAB39_00980 [Candidatus Onthovicinus excrementipullorum]|nr:hypothetical protein [Candidatus Onthovicinus excrementipullorum]